MPDEPSNEEIEAKVKKLLEGPADNPAAEELDEFELKLRDFDERLEASRKAQSEAAAEIEDDFDSRLQDLEARAKKAKGVRDHQRKEQTKRINQTGEDARGLGVGMTMAYAIIGMPILGALIGWILEQQTGSRIWTSICVLGGAVLGVVFAIFVMNRPHKDDK